MGWTSTQYTKRLTGLLAPACLRSIIIVPSRAAPLLRLSCTGPPSVPLIIVIINRPCSPLGTASSSVILRETSIFAAKITVLFYPQHLTVIILRLILYAIYVRCSFLFVKLESYYSLPVELILRDHSGLTGAMLPSRRFVTRMGVLLCFLILSRTFMIICTEDLLRFFPPALIVFASTHRDIVICCVSTVKYIYFLSLGLLTSTS